MIKVRKQNEEENLIHGDNFPVTVIIGDTKKYLTEKAFNDLKTELNKFAIPVVVGPSEQLVCSCNVNMTNVFHKGKCIKCKKPIAN